MASTRETRYVRSEVGEGDGNTLVGHTALFGVESEILYDRGVCNGPFIEVLDPHCFDRTLKENPDVRALYNHDTNHVLGRTKSGTLTLTVDDVGLAFTVQLPDTQCGRDVRESVKRGDIDGCSFGFCVVEDEIIDRPGLPALRTLKDVDLYEITPACSFPAYTQTHVEVRKDSEPVKTPRLDHAKRLYRFLFIEE